jgi:hypothetical protein
MALPEQADGVVGIVDRIAALPQALRPRVIVGGYAVKQGLVSEIPGAELLADISQLPHDSIRETQGVGVDAAR